MVGLRLCWQNGNNISWDNVNVSHYLSDTKQRLILAGVQCWRLLLLEESQGSEDAGLHSRLRLSLIIALHRCTKGFAPLRGCGAEEGLQYSKFWQGRSCHRGAAALWAGGAFLYAEKCLCHRAGQQMLLQLFPSSLPSNAFFKAIRILHKEGPSVTKLKYLSFDILCPSYILLSSCLPTRFFLSWRKKETNNFIPQKMPNCEVLLLLKPRLF